jgi:diguanylate cyclase (GGDEF)-like protein/PAS domain S-box-containing protein
MPNSPTTPEALRKRIRELEERLRETRRSEQAARAEALKYRSALTGTSQGFIIADRNLCITEVNPALLEMAGYQREEMVGGRFEQFYDRGQIVFYSASRDHLSFEAGINAKDGRILPALVHRSTLRDGGGEAQGYWFFLTDLTELKAAQEELRRAERRYRNMYRNAVQGMFQSTLAGALIRVNPAYARILGYTTPDEMLSLKRGAAGMYFDPEERRRMVRALKKKGVLTNFEVKLRRRDGKPVWALANYRLNRDDAAEPIIEGILVDNTRKKRLEDELRRGREKFRKLSMLDSLTGLFNTRYLYQAVDELVSSSRRTEEPFALIFMDMDNFKRVVDTHGHLNGSQALREVAQTIGAAIQEPCFGVAYGGDEFVVVLPGYDREQARLKAEEIRRRMQQTTYLTAFGLAVQLQASFGLAAFPQDAIDRTGILSLADKAMFRVKQKGKGSVGTAG